MLKPMQFNIFINDLFSDICNFADPNTIFVRGNEIYDIGVVLENELCKLPEWFTCNGIAVSPQKFQMMLLGLERKQELRLNIIKLDRCAVHVQNMPVIYYSRHGTSHSFVSVSFASSIVVKMCKLVLISISILFANQR